jgi:hypothetical protein
MENKGDMRRETYRQEHGRQRDVGRTKQERIGSARISTYKRQTGAFEEEMGYL